MNKYAVLNSDSSVWGVIVCDEKIIDGHVATIEKAGYFLVPQDNPDNPLSRVEPGSQLFGAVIDEKKCVYVGSVSFRGKSAEAITPEEMVEVAP